MQPNGLLIVNQTAHRFVVHSLHSWYVMLLIYFYAVFFVHY